MSKVFDQQHYDQDDNAKYELIGWLRYKGFKAWVNPDQYGIDVLASKDSKRYQFEVEVKHNWDTQGFPFDTVHWSARKLKFAEPNRYTWFVMFSNDRSQALFAPGEAVLQAECVQKNTKYTQGEWFVALPVARCMFRQMKEAW